MLSEAHCVHRIAQARDDVKLVEHELSGSYGQLRAATGSYGRLRAATGSALTVWAAGR